MGTERERERGEEAVNEGDEDEKRGMLMMKLIVHSIPSFSLPTLAARKLRSAVSRSLTRSRGLFLSNRNSV